MLRLLSKQDNQCGASILRNAVMTRSARPKSLCLVPLLIWGMSMFPVTLRAAQGDASPLQVVKDGSSKYVIVHDAKASESEKYAAKELQSYLKDCTGIELPILTGKPEEGQPMIVLGCGPTAAALGVRPQSQELGEQGCVIRAVPPHLVIAGTPQYGTLYGARNFLEKELGVRWYAPDATRTPHHASVQLSAIDRIVRPAFLWRSCSYRWPGAGKAFRSQRGLNSGPAGPDDPLGEQYSFDGTCHTYFRYISPSEFFDKHPEYFSEIGGKRVREEAQLCLTNPEVLDIVTERMLERMRKNPGARQHNFSQMDWYNYCECPKCRAINEKYGTPGGTQFWFVNELAKRTSKEFPNKLVGTLAYTYTEEPPKGLEMHPNVAVWLCHMFPSCDSHSIESCPRNADYLRRAEAWSKICSHLYVWHYVVNFAHYFEPFPNFGAIGKDMRFYQRIGTEGIYAQAAHGEFDLLRGYYVSALLQDPQQDPKALIRDFLEGYYGAAAKPIGQYIALLQDKVDKDNVHMHLYTNPAQGYLTDEVMTEANRLFDEAEAAVKDNDELLERVRIARMPLVYANAFARNGYTIEDGILRFKGPLASLTEVDEFVARIKRHQFGSIREHGGAPEQMALTRLFHAPMPLVVLENKQLRVEVAPLLGGRALRIIDHKTGGCVTAYNSKADLFFPFCGGEESRVGEYFAIFAGGPMSQFITTAQSPSSVTLVGQTANGYTMLRTLTLAEDAPILNVKVEVTNPSSKPRSAQLHAHLALDLGKARSTRVSFTSRDGKKVDRDMTDVVNELREGRRFFQGDTPAEAWTFSGPKGLSLIQRFPRDQVESAWIYCYPEDNNELEVELLAPKVMLEPGKSVSLEHSLEVRADN